MAVTERVTILMEPGQKAEITRRAKAAGMSAGEYLRIAAEKFEPEEDDLDLKRLSQVLEQLAEDARKNSRAIDALEEFVRQSNARIAALERSGQ